MCIRDSISGNYYTRLNDFDISVSAGEHKSQNVSALSGADEKDGTNNKTIGVNVSKWYDLVHWRTSWFARNTFTDIDGHNVSIQDGKWADNTFFALQTGVDYLNNSLTFHTHEYDRDYDDAHYDEEDGDVKKIAYRPMYPNFAKSKKIAPGICSLKYSSCGFLLISGICHEQSIIFTLSRFFSSQLVSTKDILSFFQIFLMIFFSWTIIF